MSRYYHNKNKHGCLYYIFFWPFVLTGEIIKYTILFSAYLVFMICTLPFMLIKEMLSSNIKISANSGEEYENACCELLRRKGFYSISTTPRTGDHGVDIIAYASGRKYAIQCKYYSSTVGNHAVQEVFSGCRYYGCEIPVVLTNSTFTENAIDEARTLGVELWEKNNIPYRQRVSYKSFFKKQDNDSEEYQSGEVESEVRKFTDEYIISIIRRNNIELDELDYYFKDVAELFIERGKGSIGTVQRKFNIGFNRAAKIVGQLEQFKVIKVHELDPISILMTAKDFAFLYEKLIEYKTEISRPIKKKMSEAEIYQYAQECEYLAQKKESE